MVCGIFAIIWNGILGVTSGRLLGRSSAGTGPAEEITVGARLTLSAGTLSADVQGGVTAHSGLTGLAADDHAQYALLTGRVTPQSLALGTATGATAGYLTSTSHATKGKYGLNAAGTIVVDEVNTRIGVGIALPAHSIHAYGATASLGSVTVSAENTTSDGFAQLVAKNNVGNLAALFVQGSFNTYYGPGGYAYLYASSGAGIGFVTSEVLRCLIESDGKVGINKSSSIGAQHHVVAGAATTIGQIIQGAASQSANLQEWQNSAGSLLTRIRSDGSLRFGPDGAERDGTISGTNGMILSVFRTELLLTTTNDVARVRLSGLDDPVGSPAELIINAGSAGQFGWPDANGSFHLRGGGGARNTPTAISDCTIRGGSLITITNGVGSNLKIGPGQSLGSGAPAKVILQGTATTVSGLTKQTIVDVLTITNSNTVTLSSDVKTVYTGSANCRATQNQILFGETTNAATAVELTSNGAAGSAATNRIAVPLNTAMSVLVNIGVKQSGSANCKQMLRQFLIVNNAGTTQIEGAVTTLGTDVTSTALAAVTCTITANNTDDCMNISVNGVMATNLRYTAYIVSTEILYT